MIVRTGDVFQIRARYDNGGYLYLQVTRAVGRHLWTIPLDMKFQPAWNHTEVKFGGRGPLSARQRLQKYWKRVTPQRSAE